MSITDKSPQFFERSLRGRMAFENISKAAFADIAWNLAARCAESADNPEQVWGEFETEARATLAQRDDSVRGIAGAK